MLRRLIFMRHAEAQMTQYGKPDKRQGYNHGWHESA